MKKFNKEIKMEKEEKNMIKNEAYISKINKIKKEMQNLSDDFYQKY